MCSQLHCGENAADDLEAVFINFKISKFRHQSLKYHEYSVVIFIPDFWTYLTKGYIEG